jgi:hypothetical protein
MVQVVSWAVANAHYGQEEEAKRTIENIEEEVESRILSCNWWYRVAVCMQSQ